MTASLREHRGLVWTVPALVLYLLVLQHFWFNAPVWDDYEAILESLVRMADAPSALDWWREAFRQHNEHRIATTRIGAWAVWSLAGYVDFRWLVLLGNAGLAGILAMTWLEFREDVPPPVFAAAAFLLFQWSYYEAALETMAALSNIGVLFFAFACLYFALRGGLLAATACVAFGVLAAASQANGLFALPIAAAGCAVARRPMRALLLAAVSAAAWVLYFQEYARPPNHPSPLLALGMPVATAKVFFLNIGSFLAGWWRPFALGAAVVAAIGWLAWRNAWKAHPTAALWILFILGSVGAAAAGRVGFGVFQASRYAVNSSILLVLVVLAASAVLKPLSPARIGWTVFWAVAASLAATGFSWFAASDYSLNGKLLAKAVPATSQIRSEPYFGEVFPSREAADKFLRDAEARDVYVPREQTVFGFEARHESTVARNARRAGHVDDVRIVGDTVIVRGWTDLPGTAPGRTLVLVTQADLPVDVTATLASRADVARSLRNPELVFSGFELRARFPDMDSALRAAGPLCLYVESPGGPPAVLHRPAVNCEPMP